MAIALDATIGPDPADLATKILEGRLLPVFADVLDESALQGARIGMLASAFGDGGAEAAAAEVVRAAIDEMVELGRIRSPWRFLTWTVSWYDPA